MKTSKSPSVGEAVGVRERKPRYVSTLATVTRAARSATILPSTSTLSDGGLVSMRNRLAMPQ
jgi:hypothetical protein